MLWDFLTSNFSFLKQWNNGFFSIAKDYIFDYIFKTTSMKNEIDAINILKNNLNNLKEIEDLLLQLDGVRIVTEDINNARLRDLFLRKKLGNNLRSDLLAFLPPICIIISLIMILFSKTILWYMLSISIFIFSLFTTKQVFSFEFGFSNDMKDLLPIIIEKIIKKI